MRTWLCCVLALGSGCLVPRSITVGQMAAPVGRGATDVGVYSGVLYASQTNPLLSNGTSRSQDRTSGVSVPYFEANLQHGFNDTFGLNVHASSAGIQPGLKWNLNKSKVAHVALLPAVAFGFASMNGSNFAEQADGTLQENNPTQRTSFTFLGGLKVLFSHKSGFYAGVGYDFLFNRNYNASLVGGGNVTDRVTSVVQTTAHQVSAAIGIDITLGFVHLRPEVAFAVYPGLAQTTSGQVGPTEVPAQTGTGGFGFAVFPGFTIAVASPQRTLSEEEQQEEEERALKEKKARQKKGEATEEDDDDDDEDDGKKLKFKKKRGNADDEEDDAARKKRRPAYGDDED